MQNIARLDKELENVEAYLNEINDRIETLEAEIIVKQNELEEAEYQRQLKYEEFKERFDMYMNRKVGYIQVLLNSRVFLIFLIGLISFLELLSMIKINGYYEENEERLKFNKKS